MITSFLSERGLQKDIIGRICYVVDHISYSKEIKGEKRACPYGEQGESELACVQDADRLDAIGAVGIARCVSQTVPQVASFHQAAEISVCVCVCVCVLWVLRFVLVPAPRFT